MPYLKLKFENLKNRRNNINGLLILFSQNLLSVALKKNHNNNKISQIYKKNPTKLHLFSPFHCGRHNSHIWPKPQTLANFVNQYDLYKTNIFLY